MVSRAPAAPGPQLRFINSIPGLTQTDIHDPVRGHGYNYCAPAVVANSIAWLTGNNSDVEQLARELASPRYMNTDTYRGTTLYGLLHGIDRIARELFGGYRHLEYQGRDTNYGHFSSGRRVPDWQTVLNAVTDNSAVWLSVGWYRYDRRNNLYHYVGAHWVTLVGYDGNTLVLHDPSPRAGQDFANEFVKTEPLQSGMLVGNGSGLPLPARGYLRLGEGMHIKRIADTAIADGAVIFYR